MGNSFLVRRYLLIFSLLLSFLSPCPASAQPQSSLPHSSAFDLAVKALEKEKPDLNEALTQIQKAISQDPSNLDYRFVLGVVYLQLNRYQEAESIFLELLRIDETRFQPVYFYLANLYAQQGKEEDVLEMLEKGRPVDPARADFETGLAYMRMNKHEQAVEYFKRAALAQSDMAGEATIHLGIAYAQLKKYKEAKNALNEALNMKLPPERTAEVKEIIDATEKAIYAVKPWQVSASAGFQYNTNVFSSSLEAINIGDLRRTTGESDVINFTSFGGRYNFFQEDPWKAGVTYTQLFATYVEHSELNLIGMRPSLFVQWDQSPYSASLEYAYNNFLVEGQQDVQVHSLVPRFVMFHGSRFRSEAATGVEWRISKPGLLDSNRYFLSLMEAYLMLEGKAHIRAGYILSHDDFISNQPDAWIHDALVGTQWPIWKDKWFLDVAGLFTWRNYDFDPVFRMDRRDDEQNLMVQVLGQLNPYTQLALGFNHTWNHSNITSQNVDLFSYTRAVYSCVITFSY